MIDAYRKIAEIVAKISFTNTQPLEGAPDIEVKAYAEGNFPDIANTEIRDLEAESFILALKEVPRFSTIAVGYLINQMVSQMPAEECYLNVGVWHGFTFLSGLHNNGDKLCIGVDNFSEFGGPKEAFLRRYESFSSPSSLFYEEDFREVFSKLEQKIGIYFYDGAHSYEDQLEALELSRPHLADDALVIVDDSNMKSVKSSALDFLKSHMKEFEVVLDIQTAKNSHPTFWNGLMILKKITK